MKTISKNTEKSLINEFIATLTKISLKKKNDNKRFSFVLTGGKSPIRLYQKLAKIKIDWSNIDLFWGDERFVSKKSKNSNYNLAYKYFIKKININRNNIFSINTNLKNSFLSSKNYSKVIKKYFKNKKISFDLILLGMGNDGHIASIFPGSKELTESFISKPVSRKDFKRITLSLNIINNSSKVVLWLNQKLISKKYDKLKNEGIKIPVNNIIKKKTLIFRIK
ncbi:6-phosphogluconolactonase [Pelagibacteraceae bacterium]|nr:6-phosphogluconolactonase [Pelagibacteraceae bacterium]